MVVRARANFTDIITSRFGASGKVLAFNLVYAPAAAESTAGEE